MLESLPDFVIPSDRDQLLQSQPGKYRVKKVLPLRELQNALLASKSLLESQGPKFILENFDTFFSILVHGTNVQLESFVLAFERIYKCLDTFVSELEKEFDRKNEPPAEDKPSLITITKMLAYLTSSLIRHVEITLFKDNTALQTKNKKKDLSKTDLEYKWNELIDKVLVLIYQWINMPLEKLWNPPVPETNFVTTVGDICYRILERCKNAKDKPIRESIFQILGVLVKRYNHSISCVIKTVQLVKMCDGLSQHLGMGIVQLIQETNCNGIVKEILREVDRATPEEGGTRNIAIFLETITALKPELILPAISNLTEHLGNECYLMRNCIIGILGTIVKEVLTAEDLSQEQKTTRDDCLDDLMTHMLDGNSYVRSKVLQVWQDLCSEGAVPITNQTPLLTATVLRLNDKTPSVRKHAFQLLRTMLQCNPFAGKLVHEDLAQQVEEEKQKLKTMQRNIGSFSEPNSKIRADMWQSLAPTVQKTVANMPAEGYSLGDQENVENLDVAFETVRQLLLGEKIEQACGILIRINSKLPGISDFDHMTDEARIDYLISLLYKIFMESQEPELEGERHSDGQADAPNARKKERQKRNQEYESQAAVLDYIKKCSDFAKVLESSIPISELRMQSVVATDAIEACSFLGIAYQFKVKGAKEMIRQALCQVFSTDASVCENLAKVYKEIYIGTDEQYKSERQKALVIVKVLTRMVWHLEPGQSPALVKLIAIWREKDVLGPESLKVMWERFSRKLPETSQEESRAALMLLTMAASTEPAIITENFDVLYKVGLGQQAETDLLLARDTCRAMIKFKVQSSNPLKCPSRLPNDHEVFEKLISILVDKCSDVNESCYTTFSIEAINAVYHLANQPEPLMKRFLNEFVKIFRPSPDSVQRKIISTPILANLVNVVGHIAIRQMVHLDMSVYKEFKRRNTLMQTAKRKKKSNTSSNATPRNVIISENEAEPPSSASRTRRNRDISTIEDNGEEVLDGATADDADAEFILSVLEQDLVTGEGLLTKFVPLITAICTHPEKYTDEQLQIAGTLAMSKMMTVSSIFCQQHLQLLITILERSQFPINRANILIGLTDLMNRFPNVVEPWTQHIYGRLRDEAPLVRHTCVKMLSSLIMKEMIRVKGQVSELAICLIDPDANISQETTRFFKELANKGNALYNIMPDILSRLTDPGLHLEEERFQQIIKFILGLLQKDKQVDSIIEKVCVRFKLATTERQWRDLAYCLSLLKFNAKGIRRLIDNLPHMKDKVQHDPVLKILQDIIQHAIKKPETKVVCIELEEKLQQMLAGNNDETKMPDSATEDMPPPATLPRSRRIKKKRRNF